MVNIINIFKLHYFLYWGSVSAILNFSIPFITKHGNVTQNDTAILYCILPLALVFAKPIFCTLADKYVIHEWVLVVSIFGTNLFYGLLLFIPFIPYKNLIWPAFCICMFLGQICSGVLTTITDSMVVKIAETNNSNFGRVRVWGTIGWGSLSLLIGYLNLFEAKLIPLYTPGIILFIVVEAIDFILMFGFIRKVRNEIQTSNLKRPRRPTLDEVIERSISVRIGHSISQSVEKSEAYTDANEEHEAEPKKKRNKQIVKFVLLTCFKHPVLIKHIIICIVIGMLTALHWNYFTLYLGMLRDKDTNLIGIASVVQCFAGEMPFMFFAQMIVDKLKPSGSLNLVLIAFSIRYLLYSFFTTDTAYFILCVEILHGVTFGLFYPVMTALASEYSKKMFAVERDYLMKHVYNQSNLTLETDLSTSCTMNDPKSNNHNQQIEKLPEEDDTTFATMQGIMSGAYEGFGVAMGSLISGFGIEGLGFKTVWYLSSGVAFVVFALDFLLILVLFLRRKFKKST